MGAAWRNELTSPLVRSASHRQVKLLTWNIRHGGRGREGKIAAALRAHDADVIVLTVLPLPLSAALDQMPAMSGSASNFHLSVPSGSMA